MPAVSDCPAYTLQRSSRRRTVEIQVRPEGVRVLAPSRVARSRIDQFVRQKAEWINQRQRELQRRLSELEPYTQKALEHGATLQWLGERCDLTVLPRGPQTVIEQCGSEIRVSLSRRIRKAESIALQEQLERWYREQADLLLQSRVRYWAEQTGLQPARVICRSYRRKWGCCNSRREVSFNWLLIMAPLWVIDYVIVHELCHLQEMNHSSRFWLLVERSYPQYRQAKRWLHENGSRLHLI